MKTRSTAILAWALIAGGGPVDAACVVDQSQESWNSTSGGFRWQSFTAAEAGVLCQVDVNASTALDGAQLEIHAGEGPGGTLLHAQVVDLAADVTQIIVDAPVPIDAGEVYTIHFEEITAWRLQTGDPYAGGTGSINPDVDFWFRAYVEAEATPSEARSWSGVKARYASE